jgi:hypothetical protein
MKTSCFSRGNENHAVHVEFSVRHHPLRIPIPMLERKFGFNEKICTKLPKLGGPVGNFPPFFLFFSLQLTKSNSNKKQKNGTDHGLTTAPFPPNPISTNRSRPPPSSRNLIPFTKILPILATSRHNAHQGRCHDVARIGVSVAP